MTPLPPPPGPRRATALLLAAALLLAGAPALRAEPRAIREPDPTERRLLLWVPPLFSEIVTRLGVDSRLLLGDREELALPGTMARADLGWRLLFDERGAFGLGLLATGAFNLPLSSDAPEGLLTQLGGALAFQHRAMSDDFIYVLFGAFVEADALFWSPEPSASPDSTPDPFPAPPTDRGFRLAVGIEAGPGLLWWLDPWLFGESVVRFGLEYVRFGGAELTSVIFGWSLAVDWATPSAGAP